jgi:hypothetical protein
MSRRASLCAARQSTFNSVTRPQRGRHLLKILGVVCMVINLSKRNIVNGTQRDARDVEVVVRHVFLLHGRRCDASSNQSQTANVLAKHSDLVI